MESDREQANLGLQVEEDTVPRKPKRRFIGRRDAQPAADEAGGIEGSNSLQGTVPSACKERKTV